MLEVGERCYFKLFFSFLRKGAILNAFRETFSALRLRNCDSKPERTRRIKVIGWRFALQVAFDLPIRCLERFPSLSI